MFTDDFYGRVREWVFTLTDWEKFKNPPVRTENSLEKIGADSFQTHLQNFQLHLAGRFHQDSNH
jgi:hypothetical protein